MFYLFMVDKGEIIDEPKSYSLVMLVGSGARMTCLLVLQVMGLATLGTLPNLSEPRLPRAYRGDNNSVFFRIR